MRFEYQVIPAPTKGEKARGVRNGAERFALALTGAINRMARDGWEYVRAESLPAEERKGWMSRTSVTQNLLVFRRPVTDDAVAEVAMKPVANAPEGIARPIGPAV